MPTWGWVVLVLAVLVVLTVLLLGRRRAARRGALRDRFGSEYDRAVREGGDRRAVEQHLSEVSQRRDELRIDDLTPQAAVVYRDRWDAAQARFVDEPGQAVADADRLVTEVLRERGYPLEDFDDRAALVATDHPDVVEHYRAAHDGYLRHLQSPASDTEELRQAFVHYRSLFHALAGPTDPTHAVDPVEG